jgi:hypothetical protein
VTLKEAIAVEPWGLEAKRQVYTSLKNLGGLRRGTCLASASPRVQAQY